MTEDELENFILKYLSERKFLKTQKKLSLEITSRKRKKSNNNFILEERFEKLKKHFFNVKKNDNNNLINVSDVSKTKTERDTPVLPLLSLNNDSSGTDTDFEEIENFYNQNQKRSQAKKTNNTLDLSVLNDETAVSIVEKENFYDAEKENLYDIDRNRIDEIIKKTKKENYKKAVERKRKAKNGEDEFKDIKQLIITKMGMNDKTEHIQHFMNSELDWPFLLRMISNEDKNGIKCTSLKCMVTAEMKPGSLTGHCKDIHNWGTFECDKCDFVTYRESGLKTHKVKHNTRKTTVTDFHCDKCDMYYKNKSTLVWHNSAVHRKEKEKTGNQTKDFTKFKKCIFCPFTHSGFNGSRPMEDHYRNHFGIKHECGICGEMFGTKFNLNQHLDQHDSIYYRCLFCCGQEVPGKGRVGRSRCLLGFISDNKNSMRRHFGENHSEENQKRTPSWKAIKDNVEEVNKNDLTEEEIMRIERIRDNRDINAVSWSAEPRSESQRKSVFQNIQAICM